MPKHLNYIFILSSLLILLSGCGKDAHNEHRNDTSDITLEMLDITFETNPPEIKVGERALLLSSISKKKEAVKNAEVKFEIWADGQDPHENIEAKHEGDGTYSSEFIFTHSGNHHVIVHVTTPELHQMIEKEFDVSN